MSNGRNLYTLKTNRLQSGSGRVGIEMEEEVGVGMTVQNSDPVMQ